jgi:hypothetical protein
LAHATRFACDVFGYGEGFAVRYGLEGLARFGAIIIGFDAEGDGFKCEDET